VTVETSPASRCVCGRACVPPVPFCPDCGREMTLAAFPGHGQILSFTTLHSPPEGFSSPLHLALVELQGGAHLFCHGSETRGLRLGTRVAVESIDAVYYFSHLGVADRARLFWRRAGASREKVSAILRSAVKRLRHPRGTEP